MVFGNKDNKASQAKVSHAQVTYKMAEDLKVIDSKRADATHRRDLAHEKIQHITSTALARLSRLTELRIRVASAREVYAAANKDAVAYTGTAGEQQAMTILREQKDLLERDENELARAEEHHKEAEARESEQLIRLRAEVQSAGDELTDLDRQRRDAQGVYERALQQLGESVYGEAVEQIEAQVRKVQADRQAVVASQLTLDQLIEDCISRLDEWPELAGKIRSQYSTYHDELTGILETYDAFLSALRKANAAATIEPSIFRAAGSPWPDMTMLLEIPLDQLARALAGRGDRLVEKQDAAKKVLGAYRATKEVK